MTLNTIFLLLLVSGLFFWRRWIKTGVVCLLVSAGLFLAIGQGWLTNRLLNDLQSAPYLEKVSWKDRNAIIILGLGTSKWPGIDQQTTQPLGQSRVREAVRLYNLCKQEMRVCTIIPSGGDPRNSGVTEADTMKRELVELGVPEADVIAENKSNNTFQNAKFTAEIVGQQGLEQVVLVTSGTHLTRSLLYFSHFGVDAIGAPSDRMNAVVSNTPVSSNFAFADLVIHEKTGYARYHFYNYMGWNAPKVNAVKAAAEAAGAAAASSTASAAGTPSAATR